jgi:hypothetical protein
MPVLLDCRETEESDDPQAIYFQVADWIAVVMFGLSLCIMAATAYMYWRDCALDASKTSTNGIIVALETHDSARHGPSFTAEYSYEVNGHSYSGTDLFSEPDWNGLRRGQALTIVYLESRPGVCRPQGCKSTPKSAYIEIEAMFAFFLVAGIPMYFAKLKRRRTRIANSS